VTAGVGCFPIASDSLLFSLNNCCNAQTQWDYYFVAQYLFSFQLYHVLVGVILVNVFFAYGSQTLSMVGFNSGKLLAIGLLSFRRTALVLVVLWF